LRTRGLEGVRARLVGMERDLDSASQALEALGAGAGGILFVTGEPGIGKTRLIAELREQFESRSAEEARGVWLEGRCASYAESIPYFPFRDLLRSWLGILSHEAELRARVALRRSLDRLFGALARDSYPY